MGLIRTTYFGIAAFLSAASIALLIVAIVIPYWQYTELNGHQVTRYGLWGYKSCISTQVVVDGKSCGSDGNPTQDYPDCGDDKDCKQLKKAIKIAKIGLIIEVCVSVLFFLYCLAKIPSRWKKVAETGCCGWCILPLPLIGSIVGSICWGLYYHYNPYRSDSNTHWGPCFWIAMAGWICGFAAWLPKCFYRFH